MNFAHIRDGIVVGVASRPNMDCIIPCPDNVECGDLFDGISWSNVDRVRKELLISIDKKTAELINSGHTYSGKIFSTSQSAQNNALAVSGMISRGMDFTGTVLSNIDNTDEHIVIDNADMQAFADSCMNYIAYHKRLGGQLKKMVRDAEDPSTVEDNR